MGRFCLPAVFCFMLISLSDEQLLDQGDLSVKIGLLERAVTALQGRVATLENQCGGCTSNTPVFMAALTADLDHCNNNAKIIFQNVKINQGSGYSGGVFTAPVAGYYAFSATLSTSDNNQYHVAFVKDNDSNKIGYMYADPSSIWMQRSSTVMTHLNQNEKVWMMCLGDSRIEGDHQHHYSGATDFHSHMSGFLVSAD